MRDFFIHKALKGSLSRELDFYRKNGVRNLEELGATGEDLAEGWFQRLLLIKRVGVHIIGFLAQIEAFQKMLWEKKFVTGTFSVLAVGSTPDAFYAEITDNAAWWKEWMHLLPLDTLPRGLLSRDRETQDDRVAFLKAYPSLTLDTRHFSPGFLDRLLAH